MFRKHVVYRLRPIQFSHTQLFLPHVFRDRTVVSRGTFCTSAQKHLTLWGGPVAKAIYEEVKVGVAELQEVGWQPRLLSIVISDLGPSTVYIRNQKRAAEKHGIEFEIMELPPSITRAEIMAMVGAKNADPRITGIMIQRPVPPHLDIKEVQQSVHPLKDVEGMHPASLGQVVYGEADLAPCTAKAAVRLLKETGLTLEGLNCVIVGASEIVGKPISFLLLREGATVTICHHLTRNLTLHTRQAEAIFVAVGKPGLLTAEMIRPGAAIIDVGINQLDDGTIIGDVDYNNVWPVAGWTTPVPRGVGTVTTAMLLQNTVVAAQRQRRHYEAAFGPSHVVTNAAMITGPGSGSASSE